MLKQYFQNCPPSIKSKLELKVFLPGQTILEAGSKPGCVYILTKGTVEVLAQNEDGQYISWGFSHPWGLFGELELFTHRNIQSQVRAVTRCELMQVPGDDFTRWLHMDSDFALHLISRISRSLLNLEDYAQLAIGGTLEQKACYILQKNTSEEQASLTKQALANRIGTSMRSLNRIVKSLAEKGCIEISGTLIRVKNGEGLQKIYKKLKRNG